MKRYISPAIKIILLSGDAHLLAGSKDPEDTIVDGGSDGDQLSNRREGGIWGSTEW